MLASKRCMHGAVLVLAPLFLLAPSAHGQSSEADSSFKEAQILLEQGKYSEACTLFELSLKQAEALGTLVNLAFCHEKAGKPARAWTEFKRASITAKGERLAFVNQHLKTLEPKVGHAKLEVGDHTISAVRIDGEPATLDGTRLTSEIGAHHITVSVDGNAQTKTTKDKVVIRTGDNNVDIKFQFEDAVAPTPPPSPQAQAPKPAPTDQGSDVKRTVGFGLAGLGVVGVGLGSYFGLRTIALKPDCPDNGVACNAAENAQGREARSQSVLATVAFVVGGASLAGGLYLILTSPSSSKTAAPTTARLSPMVGPRGGGIALEGTW